ncbi:MAG: sigma-70 family RNA polymerase sigma factor [Bacteroidales bacterium]|jgi:RNA polymerase sigma-70 factor (ECF subfamily)|nr:sigma-70 family RNA polymerase sigma factor [Bacteroidales bacterium]
MKEIQEFRTKVFPVRDKLFRMALRMTGNTHDAEDVAQEVMLKLWEIRDQLSVCRNIEAYATQTLKNTCRNRLKAKKPTDGYSADIPETGQTPAEQTENKDLIALVARIIDRLPDTQRMVMQLRDVEGYLPDEIAEIMGCNTAAVRMNLSRARKKVKDIFFKINHIQQHEPSR